LSADDLWGHLLSDEEPKAELRFKWGWNEIDGATVWDVRGPGDGLPAHGQVLKAEWGRMPDVENGDVLGVAGWLPPELWVRAYFGVDVPVAVVEEFRKLLPAAEILPSR
jgi:hypothetical protein